MYPIRILPYAKTLAIGEDPTGRFIMGFRSHFSVPKFVFLNARHTGSRVGEEIVVRTGILQFHLETHIL